MRLFTHVGRLLIVLVLVAGFFAALGSSAGAHHDEDHQQGDNGANQEGDFTSDPNAPPRESDNGLGGGNATGRPDAGSVGNADDQNPPGQSRRPEDANAGFECDRNQGVARSNPAHTGCAPEISSPPPNGENPPPNGENPPPNGENPPLGGITPPGEPGEVVAGVSTSPEQLSVQVLPAAGSGTTATEPAEGGIVWAIGLLTAGVLVTLYAWQRRTA